MAIRIDVIPTIPDARASLKLKAFREEYGGKVRAVHIVDSYLIDTELTKTGLQKARSVLTNPLVETSTVGSWFPKKYAYAIHIGFLPGVTDNVGTTAKETIEDATGTPFKEGEHVYSSQVIFIEGTLSRDAVQRIAKSLHNSLIQSAVVYGQELRTMKQNVVPRVALHGSSKVLDVDLDVSDEELQALGTYGIQDEQGKRRGPLALSLPYLKVIRTHFQKLGRKPTDVEIEALAQTWSEHCKHTIFASPLDSLTKGIYKTYIKGATEKIRAKKGKNDFCLSVFKDNAGGIIFDEHYAVTHKVETHNSPSALDPFGGAVTGIVGVNRDTLGFGLGAKPVANVYGFCFAYPEDTRKLFRDSERKDEMLSPKRIMEGVIKGINAGGNQSGIPTPNGFMIFDDSYRGKPLVFAGTVGLIPRMLGKKKLYEKKAQPGDYIVIVGGRTGVDGIHGATFSSVSLDSGSPATAVQIGDAITQKKFSDALAKEARDLGLYTSITDNGAGGFSSSISEMAKEAGGCHVELDKAPLKYPGLEPWQIWISESQERMTLSVPKKKWPALRDLMTRRGVEATVIGTFTHSSKCVVTYKKAKVMEISLDFLHDGVPLTQLHSSKPQFASGEPVIKRPKDYSLSLVSLLKRHNLSSHEFVSKQYDYEVMAGSVLKPLQGRGRVNADASVFKPVLQSSKAVVLSSGVTPYAANSDPYNMAAGAIDTAVRNAVTAGASLSHLALLDNFCWASSNEPERLWQLKEAARACYDVAVHYGTPFISGKDSMFNDFKGYDEKGEPTKISVLPTLLASSIGVIDDASYAISLDAKAVGDVVYVLGETNNELGASEYYRMIADHGQEGKWGTHVPKVDVKKNLALYKTFEKAGRKNLIASAVSVGRGGLAVALARMSMGGQLGLHVDISKLKGNANTDYAKLFSESQGRIVVSVPQSLVSQFESVYKGSAYTKIGTVTDSSFVISDGKRKLVRVSVDALTTAYRDRFKHW